MKHQMHRRRRTAILCAKLILCSAFAGMISGCVTIDAPDKPIVIELNINIKQEVIYKLDRASKQVIADNPEVF